MLNFIKENIYSVITIILFVMAMAFLYKKQRKETVRKIVLSLVVQAEKALGSGTGELKYAMVVENIYKTLPGILTLFISEKELDDMIEVAVHKMKECLSQDGTELNHM